MRKPSIQFRSLCWRHVVGIRPLFVLLARSWLKCRDLLMEFYCLNRDIRHVGKPFDCSSGSLKLIYNFILIRIFLSAHCSYFLPTLSSIPYWNYLTLRAIYEAIILKPPLRLLNVLAVLRLREEALPSCRDLVRIRRPVSSRRCMLSI